MTGPNNTAGGYTCFSCGQWVPSGESHQCSNLNPQPWGTWSYFYGPSNEILERIATALERLVALLEPEGGSKPLDGQDGQG